MRRRHLDLAGNALLRAEISLPGAEEEHDGLRDRHERREARFHIRRDPGGDFLLTRLCNSAEGDRVFASVLLRMKLDRDTDA